MSNKQIINVALGNLLNQDFGVVQTINAIKPGMNRMRVISLSISGNDGGSNQTASSLGVKCNNVLNCTDNIFITTDIVCFGTNRSFSCSLTPSNYILEITPGVSNLTFTLCSLSYNTVGQTIQGTALDTTNADLIHCVLTLELSS